ncbi:hypothetical protein Tco_0436511 [Tanacetum coccineum]
MAEIGCNWARIGPSKSSQSLSIAQKMGCEMIEGHLVFTVFILYFWAFRPIRWVIDCIPIVFFSSGSGLTADSSVLTLTLAFLDFGLDFAQSFPFHAQFSFGDEERIIPLNEIISQLPPSIAITPVLPTMEPEDSLIMRDENLSTIPEKESDEFIKSSVEDLVPIPSKSEDTSGSDSGVMIFYFLV